MIRYLVLLLLFVTSGLQAGLTRDVEISYTGMYGNGNVFIVFKSALNDTPGCSWLIIDSNNPFKDQFQSLAISALATGRLVDVSTTECSSGTTRIQNDSNHYLLVK